MLRIKLNPKTEGLVAAPPARSSIFGNAKPRETVLAAKGIDIQAKEKELDAKTFRLRTPHMNSKQLEEFKAAEGIVGFTKNELLKHKENGASDDVIKAAEEELILRETEFNSLVESFRKAEISSNAGGKRERPSERKAKFDNQKRGTDSDGFIQVRNDRDRHNNNGGGGGRGYSGGGGDYSNTRGGYRQREERPRSCYNCGKEGHISKDCSEERRERRDF